MFLKKISKSLESASVHTVAAAKSLEDASGYIADAAKTVSSNDANAANIISNQASASTTAAATEGAMPGLVTAYAAKTLISSFFTVIPDYESGNAGYKDLMDYKGADSVYEKISRNANDILDRLSIIMPALFNGAASAGNGGENTGAFREAVRNLLLESVISAPEPIFGNPAEAAPKIMEIIIWFFMYPQTTALIPSMKFLKAS
jgi:hypothetical protein